MDYKMGHGSRTIRKLNRFKKNALVLKKIFIRSKARSKNQGAENETTSGKTPVTWSAVNWYPQSVHTVHLQNYETLHTYTTPTYIHYRYNLHYPYNTYNTTHPMLYTAYWPCPCTHAQWACGWPVRLLFASDRILCAATSIGDPIMFENV